MSRRVAVPGADELFRPTASVPEPHEEAVGAAARRPAPVRAVPDLAPDAGSRAAAPQGADPAGLRVRPPVARRRHGAEPRPSGRIRHDEKITVYVCAEELLDLEHARLLLRAEHGLAVDRGRLVREALGLVIADLEANGETSLLVRRLRGQ